MIFVTVGSQMPFDRMIKTIDEWAGENGVQVVAQVGSSSLATCHVNRYESLSPDDFSMMVKRCDLLVGHAGMGTVLTGLEYSKPMLLMPRLSSRMETRNDHQVATLNWLKEKPGIYAAFDEVGMRMQLDAWIKVGFSGPASLKQVPKERQMLISAISDFIDRV